MILYPCPFAVEDDAYGKLPSWVKGGGTLITTGDFSAIKVKYQNVLDCP